MAFNQRDSPKCNHSDNNSLCEYITLHGLNRYQSPREIAREIKSTEDHEKIMNLTSKVESLQKQLDKTIKDHKTTPAERIKGLWFTENRPPYFKKRYEPRRYEGKDVWWCGKSTEGPCDEWGYHKPSECPLFVLTNPKFHKKTQKRKAASATMVELPSGKICHSPHKMIKRSDVSDKNKRTH